MKSTVLPARGPRRGCLSVVAGARLCLGCLFWLPAQAQVQAPAPAPAPAQAPEAGVRSTTLSTSVDTLFTYQVNSSRGGLRGGDFVSEVRPGLQFNSRSGRVVGSLSYALSLVHHTEQFDGETTQNQLNANFSAEAVERWMYVDGSATISQQTASAFGQQSVAGSTQSNANRIEVGTLNLSPYVRGVLGSAVNYEVRLNGSATNGRRSIAADSTQTGGSLSLSSAAGGALFGWGLLALTQTNDFRAGRETKNDRYSASLNFAPDVDLSFTLRGGQESTNVANLNKITYDNWGAGTTWRPSPRTRAQVDFDDRYFGRSYRLLLEHRLASSALQFSSTRDASNGSDPNAAGQRTSLYQVFFAQFASIEPDPVLRETLVRNFLLAQGLDPNAVVSGGFVSAAVTLQQRHQLTLSYAGQRMAGSLQAFASNNEIIDSASTAFAAGDTRQWGYLATASYRLSATSNVSLTGSRLLTQGSAAQGGSALKSLALGYGDQLALRTTISLGARYSVFNSAINPYREAAVTASLSLRF